MLVGYSNLKQINETTNTRIYQGTREVDNLAVIIKLIKAQYPTLKTFHRYRQEFEIINCLEHPGIIKVYELIRYKNSLGIVMEDCSAESLNQLSVATKFTLKEVLELSLKIIDALKIVHQSNVIHKDINPSNILFNQQTGILKLIDFGIATQLPKEQKSIQNYKTLEGTLAYISPEQTGRMNRSLDYRSDYYSLGVTLYQLLTQQLPFQHQESRSLIHAHLAKIPNSPQQLNSRIPLAVSDIVMKLMSKNAEDRYQSSVGIKHDLEICLNQLNNNGEIKEFKLGRKDIFDRFIIPDKLYGRETEVKILLDSFERVAQGNSEMMLVAGFSGIGKTAVVNEVHKPITRQKGYFIKGKYDQFNRNIPFSAFVQAFSGLVKQLLAESDEKLSQWKSEILAALGNSAQVIINVIPNLEIILGKQQAVAELSGSAAQNRFNLVFSKFVQVFTKQEHPLIIFLDDLQWADLASLNLLQLLMSESTDISLLIIGAYRDNEVFPAHPLMLCLQEIEVQQASTKTITLKPLKESNINNIVADTLLCSDAAAQPLTKLIYPKTQGNPFFSTQFLQGLYEDGYIAYEIQENCWQCNFTKLRQLTLTDDVVEFMVSRLQKLSIATQRVLKLAACIGNQFDLNALSIICEQSEVETTNDLWSALQVGLIIPEAEIYRLYAGNEVNNTSEASAIEYRFLHDRVQQAAYALILEQDKISIHWNIGQSLLNKLSLEQQEEQLFQIVNQLNLGKQKATNFPDKQNLAEFNLQAGTKAKLAAAFQAAYEYFNHGIDLLSEIFWSTHYELTYQLHFNAAETAYLSSDFAQAEKLYEISLTKAKSVLDQAAIYRLQMTQYQLQGLNLESISVQRKSLKLLGWEVPETPKGIELELESQIDIVNKFLQNHNIDSVLNFSSMTDNVCKEILRILQILFYAAWHDSQINLAFLALAKITTLSLLNGNSETSPFGYVGYGLLLNSYLQETSLAYDFGKMAVQLCEQFDNADVKAMTNFLFAADVQSWCKPIKEAETYYKNAYKYGMEAGNWLTVSFMMMQSGSDRLTAGRNLNELYKLAETHGNFMYQVRSLDKLDVLTVGVLQPIRNLLGLTQEVDNFDDQHFQEAIFLEKYQDTPYHLAWLYSVKIRHAYLFQLQETFFELIPKLKIIEESVPSHAKVPSTVFYVGLMYLSLIENETSEKLSAQYWQSLANIETKLDRWCKNCPANILHKKLLIQAEKSRLQGQQAEALDYYENAIAQAKAQDYIYEEALANELAAKFFLDWGKDKVAAGYMQEAYYCYAQWGAKAKTNHLEQHYPELLRPILKLQKQAFNPLLTLSSASNISSRSIQTICTLNDTFDLADILQAAQALTETLELETLLNKLSQIMLQNSGSDRLIVALADSLNTWEIKVCADTEKIEVFEQSSEINLAHPVQLFNYVKNTQEIVLVDNLETDLPIIDDYLIKENPQSLLALPLKFQGTIIGVVYLHSANASKVFNPERTIVLEFLCSQAAIALHNSQLYTQEQAKVKKFKPSHRKLESIIEQAPVAIIEWSKDFKFQTWNPAAENIFGYSAEEILGERFDLIVPPEYKDYVEDVANSILRQDRGSHAINENITKNNQRITCEWFNAPMKDREGKVSGGISMALDISDRKRVEEKLQRTNEQLVHATQMKDEFLANMSHELRTPLNTILGMTESLQDEIFGKINREQKKALDTVEHSGSHLLELIDDILDLTKIESGHVELEYSVVEVNQLCQSSLKFIEQQAKKKQIQLHLNLSFNLPDIRVDKRRICQALINILNNAGIVTPEGGSITLEVSMLSPEKTGDSKYLSFAIKDTGIGIAKHDIQRLFQPFTQIDSSLNSQYVGTGLGLFLVKRIIDLHHGNLTVTSEEKVGSCFTINLPYQKVTDCKLKVQLTKESTLVAPQKTGIVTSPLILLVEDNIANSSMISTYLQAKGYRLQIAHDGHSALELAQAEQPNVILMDIQMPRMDGFTAIKHIRQCSSTAKIPIIAMTAFAMEKDRKKCLMVGANLYLTKPVILKSLLKTIQKLLGSSLKS